MKIVHKRSDITDLDVVRAYFEYKKGSGDAPYERLTRDFQCSSKIALRACERAEERGLIEYGTSIRFGWVTKKGLELWEARRDG